MLYHSRPEKGGQQTFKELEAVHVSLFSAKEYHQTIIYLRGA
jgi:hypothetical protein